MEKHYGRNVSGRMVVIIFVLVFLDGRLVSSTDLLVAPLCNIDAHRTYRFMNARDSTAHQLVDCG